ncbi:MAG: AI-2E family transporter [Chloroflexota bacterium]|nr:AI-2E family transporter [Chloroflexota bacterium]
MSSGVRRHWRLASLLLVLALAGWLLYVLRSAVLPFVTGLVLAYLLLPVISWIEQRLPYPGKWQQTKRVSLIILIYLVMLGLVGIFAFFIITTMANSLVILVNNASEYITAGLLKLGEWVSFARQLLPAEMQYQLDKLLLDIGNIAGNGIESLFMRGIAFIPSTFGLIFGFAALPIFLFYLLKDWARLRQSFYSALSPWAADHARNIAAIIEGVLGRYIRAQLLLGFIVGYMCFVGLLILRVQFAPALAALAAVTELVPVLGPWIGGGVAVIVTLAILPDKAIWVAVLFGVVQLVENNLLVPRIQGAYLRVHPAIAMVLLVLGAYVAGFWGIILAVPLAATAVQIYKYVRQCITDAEARDAVELVKK